MLLYLRLPEEEDVSCSIPLQTEAQLCGLKQRTPPFSIPLQTEAQTCGLKPNPAKRNVTQKTEAQPRRL